MNPVDRAIQLKSELDALRPLAPDIERKVLDKLRLDWNYHSNHLEGNQLDYGETKALLLHGITAQGKPLRDHLEIRGHNEAIGLLLDMVRNNTPISQTEVRNLHKTILGEPYEVNAITPDGSPSRKQVVPGEYKTQPNHVRTATGEIFHFAEPFAVPSKMADLFDWLGKQRTTVAANPILVAATFHYEFVRIHPFDDGNGRMARLLMNLELMRAGFPPAVIRTEEKDSYFSALRQADGGNLVAFAEHIAERVERSLSTMLAAAKGQAIDEPSDLDKKLLLLEQTLKADAKIRDATRSVSSIQQVFDRLVEPAGRQLVASLIKFERFFDKNAKCVYINSHRRGAADFDEELINARQRIDDQASSFAILVTLSDPKVIGLSDSRSEIFFNLRRNDFSLHVRVSASKDSFNDLIGDFGYDQLPDLAAIQPALKKISERLLNSIEHAAKQNSNSK
jgi:Fic family protein